MQVYTGKALEEFLAGAADKDYKKRYLYDDLSSYIAGTNGQENKVCCLYGLRRTGKTVMMHQAMRDIGRYEDILLIRCECDEDKKQYDTMQMVRANVKENPDCHYIFIDEITKTRNFIGTASFLADDYAACGKKVIIAGTDSFGFSLTKKNELLDRMYRIHTTYIPYKEYHELLGKDIMDYIKYGGTLTDGSVFYNEGEFKEYLNSSIVYNIIHGLERWNQGRSFGVLEEVVAHGDLPSFINKVVEFHNRTFLVRVINEDFKSHDLGSLIDLMTKHDIANTTPLESEELKESIRYALGIKNDYFYPADDECAEQIIKYLTDLDVLFKIPDSNTKHNEYIFTQVGIRYWQAEALIGILMASDEFSQNYNDVQKYNIQKKIEDDVCGGILEDIVFYQLYTSLKGTDVKKPQNPEIKIAKYRNTENQEIDVLVENLDKETTVAIEVKLSEIKDIGQLKHLTNDEFCEEVENKTGTKITNKVVVYRGTTSDSGIPGVHYINVEELLENPKEIIGLMLEKPVSIDEIKEQISKKSKKDDIYCEASKEIIHDHLTVCEDEYDDR